MFLQLLYVAVVDRYCYLYYYYKYYSFRLYSNDDSNHLRLLLRNGFGLLFDILFVVVVVVVVFYIEGGKSGTLVSGMSQFLDMKNNK